MGSLQSLAMMVALSSLGQAGGETVLYDFTATWCGPCQQMGPVVDSLAARGYPVKKVDIDRERELAAKYRVSSIPCFVMVVNGREVDREVGVVSQARLAQMLAKAVMPQSQRRPQALAQSPDDIPPLAPPQNVTPTRSDSFEHDIASGGGSSTGGDRFVSNPVHPAVSANSPAAATSSVDERTSQLMAATVRIKVEDHDGNSFGTGTIIDTRGDEALVLTCGHIFRDSGGKGRIFVETDGGRGGQPVAGRLVSYDLKRDLGLLSFRPASTVGVVRVASKQTSVEQGDRVASAGCNNGNEASVRRSRVTAIDKYLGPPNIEVAGAPVEGRSGGGLFDDDGHLIGVCFAADPKDDEGVYAGLESIHAELDRLGLSSIYASTAAEPIAAAPLQPKTQAPPPMPREMPSPPATTLVGAPAGDDARGQLSPTEQAALAEIAERSRDAEVICIIRPLSDPGAKSEIIVLDRASPLFLEQLSAASRTNNGRRLTSHNVPAAEANRPPSNLAEVDAAGWRWKR